MDVYELLNQPVSATPDMLGNAFLKLYKCYEYAMLGATDPYEEELLRSKLDQVREIVTESYPVGIYGINYEHGMYDSYKTALERLASAKGNNNQMSAAMSSIGDAVAEDPGSVLASVLASVVKDSLEYAKREQGDE
ncbi:MAG: hypothetical protein IKO61_02685 [Lachnospiraceae bacterium]|nr:hypothetical protein [Lachnospiraceae bacterium]